MNTETMNSEYYIFIRRNYEASWHVASRHTSQQKAEAALQKMRKFTGIVNFTNAQLLMLSHTEAEREFGTEWEDLFLKRDTNRMITRECATHIVQNPCGSPLVLFQRTYHYWRPTGEQVGTGWYFYYERPNGEITQLFGPYDTHDQAARWASDDAFRFNVNHLWRSGPSSPCPDQSRQQ
jgi:hypothetical protein